MDVDQPWDDELAARVECLHGLGRGGAQPTPNPVGLWTINGNGFPGVLSIPSLDPQGTLGAGSTVYGQHIFGFWDDPAQKLTCMRVSAPTDPTTFGDPLFVGR